MTTFPIDIPASFKILNAKQDAVSDNVVLARDARGQILAQDQGAPQWKGNFTLRPMSVNEPMYSDWRIFVSQIQKSLGTFKMPPVDVLTGQTHPSPPCFCRVNRAPAGSAVIRGGPTEGDDSLVGIKWFTYENNLYEVIAETAEHNTHEFTINPPLVTSIDEGILTTLSDEDAYCIARATTITHPTITTNGLYQGAGVYWEQDIQI